MTDVRHDTYKRTDESVVRHVQPPILQRRVASATAGIGQLAHKTRLDVVQTQAYAHGMEVLRLCDTSEHILRLHRTRDADSAPARDDTLLYSMERHTRRCAARQRVPQHHEQTEHAPRMGYQRVSIHARQENSRTTQRQMPATGSRIGEQPRRMFSHGGQPALCRTIEITAKKRRRRHTTRMVCLHRPVLLRFHHRKVAPRAQGKARSV